MGEEEAALEAGDLAEAVEVNLRIWVDGPRREPEDVDPAVRARVGEMQLRAFELQVPSARAPRRSCSCPTLPSGLGEVKAPTLILVGEEDVPDMHAIAKRLEREIPGSRRETIANTPRPEHGAAPGVRRARAPLPRGPLSASPPPSSSRGSGRATRRSGRARTRRGGSAGSTSRCGSVAGSAISCASSKTSPRPADRYLRAARDGRLEPCARGAQAPSARVVPRARHDAPGGLRRLAESLDFDATLFIAASKSGTTLETRSHLDFFWERAGKRGEFFAAITDPGSELARLAKERGFLGIFDGEPTIGGRYSALSVFGLVPAVLMGVDLVRFLERVEETVEACHGEEGNPGLELGLELGNGWSEGRDKVTINPNPGGFGLWAEQLLAESTGKAGKGLIPAPEESSEGPDRQAPEVRLPSPYELGQEFYRWEFATAVAGSILGINPFDQPNVQAAKDKTNEVLAEGEPDVEPRGSLDELFAQARPGDYVAVQAFIDPEREPELEPLLERAREDTGCVVTHGLGPRYLHSTGQLHKGGPNTGLFVQVVDDAGDELKIPGRDFGFRRLIHSQAAGRLRESSGGA